MNQDIQFTIPHDRFQELENLMQELGLQHNEDLVLLGLRILVWAVNARKGGCVISSIDVRAQIYTELVDPILERIHID